MLDTRTVSAATLPTRSTTKLSLLPTIAVVTGLSLGSLAVAGGPQFVDETSSRFPTPAATDYTNQLTVGDIDNDGDLDIIFANGGNFASAGTPQLLRIYINNGSGVFTDESVARTGGLTFLARGVELGDIERDGDLDIIVAQDFNRQPTLLVNNGSGVFTNETATRLPTGTFSSTRGQFADVDNDGDLDLYLTNGGPSSRFGSGRGKLWLNDGNGVFTDVTTTNTPNQNISEPSDCIFGDVDGDFDLDLRIGSTGSVQSKLYKNNGNGEFLFQATPNDANCYSYDFGDMDNNGTLDMLGANGSASGNNAEISLLNSGTGLFSVGPFTGSNTDDNDSKFLDIDNDGDFDIIIASLGSTERIYAWDHGAFSLVSGAITAVADSSLDVMVADFNGDGRYDIVTGQGESGSFVNRIYMNNGPVDTLPPNITLEQLDDVNEEFGPFVVRATIIDAHTSDRGFHDKGIALHWRIGGAGPFTEEDMLWSGNSMWRGVIPAQAGGGLVEYYVTAIDFANNMATSATLDFEIIVPEPPCPADIVDSGTFMPPPDGVVDGADLAFLLGEWGRAPGSPADLVTSKTFMPPPDGIVDGADLATLLGAWGACE